MTCTFLSEVDVAPAGIAMAVYALRGRHTSQCNTPDQGSSHRALCSTQGVAGVAPGRAKQVSLDPLSFYLKKKFRLETVKTTPLASLPCSQVLRLEIDCADEEGSRCGFHTQSLLAHDY